MHSFEARGDPFIQQWLSSLPVQAQDTLNHICSRLKRSYCQLSQSAAPPTLYLASRCYSWRVSRNLRPDNLS